MKPKINGATRAFMFAVASIIDFTQLGINMLPFVGFLLSLILGPVLTISALLLFTIWFAALGVWIFKPPYLKITIVVLIIEFLPFLDSIAPGWVGFVHYICSRANRVQSKV